MMVPCYQCVITKNHLLPLICYDTFVPQNPMQLVAPRAVSTAEMILASICSVHFRTSFFLILTYSPINPL